MKPQELKIGYKWVVGYDGLYSVSTSGEVYSHISNKHLKQNENIHGYPMVCLYKNKGSKYVAVHRLVALAHIPKPYNKNVVDHIDTNKKNNNVSNLRWCTTKENCNNPLTLLHAGESRKGEKHYMYGKKMSSLSRERLSISKKGHIVTQETRKKIGNANRGRKMTDEQKLKMSNAQKGKKLSSENPQSKAVIQFDKQINLIKTWQCISDASKMLNISISAISNCLKGLSKTSGGYIWRYA